MAFSSKLTMLPHELLEPRMFHDGISWCCLLGESMTEGIIGYGATPERAAAEFDHDFAERGTSGLPLEHAIRADRRIKAAQEALGG